MKKLIFRIKCALGFHGAYEAMAGENVSHPNRYCGHCGKQMKRR